LIRRWDLWGALAGLAVGVADTWLLSAQGVEMRAAGRDATLLVGATFTSSLAILGFLSGSLLRARARARADAATIKRQLETLEVSQRVAFENEKLAAIGRLAAGIAHEVRNPLGVIRASASMIQESFQAGDESHRACQFICEEIDRLDGLITALLQFARPSELRVQSVALDKVIDRALQLADDDLRQREIEVVGRQTLGSLPEVQADPDLLAQLLLGLVTNAAEALERGGRIELRGERDADEVCLSLADSGPGIAPEDAARVFEPFFTTKPTGTGLGLAMAARIAAAHCGRLEAIHGSGAGASGAGACLRLHLPVNGPEGIA
jgi:two-component system sensor histidine kinase HydH